MRTFLILAALALPSLSFADTLDWRNCQPHSEADSVEYRAWLEGHISADEAAKLADSFRRGDGPSYDPDCSGLKPLTAVPVDPVTTN